MNWAHLPVAGGLYDQHPELIDRFAILFAAKNNRERLMAEKQKQDAERARKGGRGRVRGR